MEEKKTKSEPREWFEPRRVPINPYNVWARPSFEHLLDRICGEEVNAMMAFGAPPPNQEQRREMREIAMRHVNAYADPAGNA